METIIDNLVGTIAFFGSTVILVIAIMNFILRMRILNSEYRDEAHVKLLYKTLDFRDSSLKWALLLFFGGLGVVVIYFLPIQKAQESPLAYGLEAIFLSIGFFVYYLTVGRRRE